MMTTRWLTGLIVLACMGCGGPAVTSRPVQSEATWLVRLDTFSDVRSAGDLRYDHPVDWNEPDLEAILTRLLVLERGGLLDQPSPPQPVFSSGEIKQLVPGLRKAFRMAQPSEWLVFSSMLPAGAVQEVTSGGMFIKERRLHVVLANHRERVPPGPGGADAAQANPLRPLGGKGRTMSFDSPRYVVATQSNWMGDSSGTPSSELTLDHTAFLVDARPSPPPAIPAAAPTGIGTASPPPQTLPSAGLPKTDANEARDSSLKDQTAGTTQEVARLRQKLEEQESEIAQLKTRLRDFDLHTRELERLRRTIEEQTTEVAQLKARLSELEASQKKPTPKQPRR